MKKKTGWIVLLAFLVSGCVMGVSHGPNGETCQMKGYPGYVSSTCSDANGKQVSSSSMVIL